MSGSSGHLVLCHRPVDAAERTWPGQAFARTDQTYAEMMAQFVATRHAKRAMSVPPTDETTEDPSAVTTKAQRQGWRSAWQRLETSRREDRARRQVEDGIWQEQCRAHQAALVAVRRERVGGQSGWKIRAGQIQARWRAAWAFRHQEFAQRRLRDAQWREQRQALRDRATRPTKTVVWWAILVVVDNCTRQSLGLPLFTMGVHVTAEVIVAALQTLLPPALRYLIADGGPHFEAAALRDLATTRGFVRVPLAPHRPQSNGIVERFIQTLKTWLATTHWDSASDLFALLDEFQSYYNDRPHQGAELAGLSPNEYSARQAAV